MEVVIIGGGLSGLSTAYHLKTDFTLYESESELGGLFRSRYIDGFTFDYAPHLFHLANPYVNNFVSGLLGKNMQKMQKNVWIYSKKTYTRYPFQANTYGLPIDVIKDCFIGLVKAKYEKNDMVVKNFEDWILKNLGGGIAKHFMIPYNEKMWTVHPREMTTDWMKSFVPQVTIGQFIEGMLTSSDQKIGHSDFWYPLKGGAGELPKALAKKIKRKIQTGKKIISININKKEILIDNEKINYDVLISTIPLNHLINIIEDVPNNIKENSNNLMYNSVLNVNLGVNDEITDKQWVYVPEKDYVFYRFSTPVNFSKNNSPGGCSSISIEISYSKNKPLPKGDIVERVIKDLIKMEIIKSHESVITKDTVYITPAYVMYNYKYATTIGLIHPFLNKNNIYSIGRYGSWEYSNLEGAIMEGKITAEKINGMVR